MSTQPSGAFCSAFSAATAAVALQAVRHPAIAKRLSAAAATLIASMALTLTAVPHDAQAQNTNQVKRTAIDALAGIAGAALGHQVGGGNGKKAATVVGAAAGVWAAEAMQDNGRSTTSSNNGSLRDARDTMGAGFGPTIAPGWGDVRVPGMDQQRSARGAQLQSGVTVLSGDRVGKLVDLERTFLITRDDYARTIFLSQQAQDDVVLDPNNRLAQQSASGAAAQSRAAKESYEGSRTAFVTAVEYLGQRGYDVHQFAYSHKIASSRVTGNDMSRGEMARVLPGRPGVAAQSDIVSGPRVDNF